MSAGVIRSEALSGRVITGVGLAGVGLYVAVLLTLMRTTSYDLWGAMVVAPVLVAITIPILRRQAWREADPRLFWILFAALLLKLLGSLARSYQVFVLYEKGDARSYHEAGVRVAERFLAGNLDHGLGPLSEEDVIGLVTGVVYTITRPSILVGFLVFSWLAFLGIFWFYRGFQLAVPEGRARTYARLVFFLPSMLFWPSSLGKEAWMVFTLGLASFGVARLMTARWRGLIPVGIGLLGAGLVRPHFAGIAGAALACALVVKRTSPKLRQLGPAVKIGLVAGLVGILILLLGTIEGFFIGKGFEVGRGLDSVAGIRGVLDQTTSQTSSGGSEFRVSGFDSPVGAAQSVATVLFRPLPIEAGNAQALATALESTALLVLSLIRWRWIWASVRRLRRQPYLVFAGAFAFGSIVALSAIANFGILARERVLLTPAFLALLSVPPRRRSAAEMALVRQTPGPVPV